jgi:hypothetical protein
VDPGLTAWVPPVACRVYVLPSDPVITTWVALVAATVRIDELPVEMEVGLAAILTVGAGFEAALTLTVTAAVAFPVDPVAVAI